MAKAEIKLDNAGWAEVLKSSEVRSLVNDAASRVAATTRGSLPGGTDVVVDSYTTDRAAASVTIRHALGRMWQVRNGVLTRAAAANGLEVSAQGGTGVLDAEADENRLVSYTSKSGRTSQITARQAANYTRNRS